jgi:hypothetical protein
MEYSEGKEVKYCNVGYVLNCGMLRNKKLEGLRDDHHPKN